MGTARWGLPRLRRGGDAAGGDTAAGDTAGGGDGEGSSDTVDAAREARARRTRRRQTAALCGVLCAGLLGATGTYVAMRGNGGNGSGTPNADLRPARPTDTPTTPTTPGAATTDTGDGGDGANGDTATHLLGDGSTSDTGPQPHQLVPHKLKPGEKPPQFVVFSWDGALENGDHYFSRFRKVAAENDAHMTFFLSGIYLLPKDKRTLYHPPQHSPGDSAIDFPTDEHIRWTLQQLSQAWQDGDEIGTHFNGHFCAPDPGGGGNWSTADWNSEIAQAKSFVENWKTNTGFADLPPLPFDYSKELAGGRAPCLEGQKNLLPAEKANGWRYDASSPGDFQLWPAKKDGVWNFPLQLMPYPGRDQQVLAMDFNFLYNQSGPDTTQGDPSQFPVWEREARQAYLNGFDRVYNGNRAPLFIGNHFETWNGGIYMQAVEDVVKDVCHRKDVQCVSFKELSDWLDAQDPAVLAKLRTLDPAESPDWPTFLK